MKIISFQLTLKNAKTKFLIEIDQPLSPQIILKIVSQFHNIIRKYKYDYNQCILVVTYTNKELNLELEMNSQLFTMNILLQLGDLFFTSDNFELIKDFHAINIIREFNQEHEQISRNHYNSCLLEVEKNWRQSSNKVVQDVICNTIKIPFRVQSNKKYNQQKKKKKKGRKRRGIPYNSYLDKTYIDYISQTPYKQKPYINVAIIN